MIAIKDMDMPSCCYECDLHNYHNCDLTNDGIEKYLDDGSKHPNCPLVEIEERKVGKWIKYNTTEKFDMFGDRVKVSSYKCSECGRIISDISEDGFTNKLQDYPYCHCGAEMEGGEND